MNAEPTSSGRTKQEILQARALALARPPREIEAAASTLQVVEFQLAHERYAVETVFVREVYPLKEITAVPCTPPFVLGIINVRGQIVTVIDIKRFFDLPQKGISDMNKVIIVRSEDMEVGFLADAITGDRFLDLRSIQASLPTLTGIRGDYLRGVTSDRLTVLDVERILSDKAVIVNESIDI